MFVSGYLMSVYQKITNTSELDPYKRKTDIFDIGADAASALALIVVYGIVIASVSNGLEFVQAICGGIPFIDAIADFGSIKNVFMKKTDLFVIEFCNVVVLSAIIDIIKKFFAVSALRRGSMQRIFTSIISALIGLAVFNFSVKVSDTYSNIVTSIGAVVSGFSLFSATWMIFNRKAIVATGFTVVAIFADNPISNFFRESLMKAVGYVLLILIIETFFGNFSSGLDVVINIAIAFAPVLIMLMGIAVMIKSLK